MTEPPRQDSVALMETYLRERVQNVLAYMETKGFDPEVFETLRSRDRQAYLFGQGRSKLQCIVAGISPQWSQPGEKRVTDTMHSMHLPDSDGLSKAVDIISVSRQWKWPAFYIALQRAYHLQGFKTLERIGDLDHGEWQG